MIFSLAPNGSTFRVRFACISVDTGRIMIVDVMTVQLPFSETFSLEVRCSTLNQIGKQFMHREKSIIDIWYGQYRFKN